MDNNFIEQYLYNYFDEVTPKEFYRDIFPKGELQKQGDYEKNKYNAIAVEITENKIKRYTITDELEQIDKLLKSDNFIIVSPMSYVGKSRKSENARYIYALAIDLDGVTELHYLTDLFYQIENGIQPKPTYVVSSGRGLHLYYVFKKPIPLFSNIVKQLSDLRNDLIKGLWNKYVTTEYENIQYESLFQGFRLVGGVTKYGGRTKAYITGEKIDIEYLNNFVMNDKNKVTDFVYKSNLTLAEAKEKYPQWYEKRIIKKLPKNTWTCKKDLYEWWCREIIKGAKVGHRYYDIMCLSIYAKKCGVSKKELEAKAFELLPYFDNISESEDNRFTEYDILKALEMYNDSYITFPIKSISRLSGIEIKRNKRNYRKQQTHIRYMNNIKAFKILEGECSPGGRPKGSTKDTTPKAEIIKQWRIDNPQGTPKQCIKKTGISKNTVYKWWNT